MTLEQLRIFLAAAERQHITQAARALNLAQSAVSHAIAALEARHDTRLFERIGRRVELTEAGQALLAEARLILAQVDHAERRLRDFGSLARGTLAVQASQTIAGYWLPRHLVGFHRAHPGIEIQLTIGNTAQVAEAIATGAAELGFVEGAVEGQELVGRTVARDQLVIVVGPDHPWARGRVPRPEDLAAAEWVLRERGSGTRSVFEAALAGLGLAPGRLRIAMELPSNEAVRAAVEAGLGATAISASVVAPGIEAGLLRHIPFALPERQFHLLSHARRGTSRIAEAFIAHLGPPRGG